MATTAAASTEVNRELAGLRVLITRPRQQAAKWRRLLEANGAATVSVPLLEIVPYDEQCGQGLEAMKQVLLQLERYQHGIFVSQNAARYGLDWMEKFSPHLPSGLKFYAVGAATAELLRQRGLKVVAAEGSMNSEELLQLPPLQQLQQQRVVIFRGSGGRPLLADSLAERGARVDFCELYRRQLPAAAKSALQQLPPVAAQDVISVHSGETLENFSQVAGSLANETILGAGACLHIPLLVPGERVAGLAGELGFKHVIRAVNASDKSMLEALLNWQNTR